MGCCSCTVTTKKCLVFGIGGGLLVVGLFIGGFMNMIVDSVLRSTMVLKPGSLTYDKWIKLPVDLYMEFYMFNVTNAEEYKKNQTIKPVLKEIGPYVFREYHGRNVIAWNDNGTVTFQNIRTWQFAPELSVGSENDRFITLNTVAATLNYLARLMGLLERAFLSSLLTVSGEPMFVNKTVRELMYEGYPDKILDLVNQLNSSIKIPFKEFGYFVDRNGSETYDGVFNMYTGENNIELLGTVAEWNYNSSTPYYDPPCNHVAGTTGELWGPIKNPNNVVGIFSPDICTTLKMKYSGVAELNGLEGYDYLLRDNAFNGSDPEAACICLSDTECLPAGLLNVSACRFNAPVFVSRPHFLLSDSSLLDAVEGLKPDPEKHKLRLGLEPTTGAPMYVDARLMLNVMIEPVEYISMFENLPRRLYFPIFWFNQKAVLSEELTTLAKLVQIAPDVGMGVFFGLAGIGALMIFIGIMLTVRNGWKGSDTEVLLYK